VPREGESIHGRPGPKLVLQQVPEPKTVKNRMPSSEPSRVRLTPGQASADRLDLEERLEAQPDGRCGTCITMGLMRLGLASRDR